MLIYQQKLGTEVYILCTCLNIHNILRKARCPTSKLIGVKRKKKKKTLKSIHLTWSERLKKCYHSFFSRGKENRIKNVCEIICQEYIGNLEKQNQLQVIKNPEALFGISQCNRYSQLTQCPRRPGDLLAPDVFKLNIS